MTYEGQNLLNQGRIDQGLVHLQRALSFDQANGLSSLYIGMYLARENMHEQAESFLRRAIMFANPKLYNANDVHGNLGKTLLSLHKLGEAIAHLEFCKENISDATNSNYVPILGLLVRALAARESELQGEDRAIDTRRIMDLADESFRDAEKAGNVLEVAETLGT